MGKTSRKQDIRNRLRRDSRVCHTGGRRRTSQGVGAITTFEKTPGVQREVMEHRVQSIYVHTGLWTMSLRSLHPKDSISVGETGRQQSEWCWGKEEKPGFHKCWSSHQPQTLGSCLLGGVLHTRRKVPLHCKQSPKKSDRT